MTPDDIPTDIILRIVNQLGRYFADRDGKEDILELTSQRFRHCCHIQVVVLGSIDWLVDDDQAWVFEAAHPETAFDRPPPTRVDPCHSGHRQKNF